MKVMHKTVHSLIHKKQGFIHRVSVLNWALLDIHLRIGYQYELFG